MQQEDLGFLSKTLKYSILACKQIFQIKFG